MAKSIYLDRAMQPDDLMLTVTLGIHKPQWDALIGYIAKTYATVSQEWKYYGKA